MLKDLWPKLVAKINQRKHNETHDNLCFGGKKVSQAKTLDNKELKALLRHVSNKKFAARDRLMILLTHLAGMRIGEVAAVRVGDVLALDGSVKEEMRLSADQTKGRRGRTVVLSKKLRDEILSYLHWRFGTEQLIAVTYTDAMSKPLFATQKRDGFTANTACNHLFMLYKAAGIEGSSHSGRRSFLTSLSAKAVPLRVMMELAGHRQAQTTMRYCDVTMDMKRAAVSLL